MMHKVEVVKKLNEQGYDAMIDGHGSIIVLVPEDTIWIKNLQVTRKC